MKAVKRREALGQPIAPRQTAKLQRCRVDEALQESGVRTLFDANHDYIYLTDIQGRILDANTALLKRVGLSLEQMRQKRFMDFFAGDNPTEVLHAFAALQRGREVKELEVRAKTERGEIFEYEVNAVPLWEGEKVMATLSMARDVTACKQAEEQLRTFHQQMRAFAAHLQPVREGDSVRPMRQHNPLPKILIPPHEALSDREYQVMRLLAAGQRVGVIAKELFLSVATIKTYRARILEKLNVRNNVELVHYALRYRLVS